MAMIISTLQFRKRCMLYDMHIEHLEKVKRKEKVKKRKHNKLLDVLKDNFHQ